MSTSKKEKITPLMIQYHDIRAKNPDVMLMFQVGDFYELFFEDAKKAASFLGITLTSRGKHQGEPIPLCGVPVHALDHYLAKLVRGGFRVAVCDQLEEARPGTVVKRGITQILTPGTLTDSKLLDDKSASYLLSFFPAADRWGLLFGELLSAQLFATVLKAGEESVLASELARFFPDEVLLPNNPLGKKFKKHFDRQGYFTTFGLPDDINEGGAMEAKRWVERQFASESVKAVSECQPIRDAVYNFFSYVRNTQNTALEQFKEVKVYSPDDFLVLDADTQRNLEVVRGLKDGSRRNTLLGLMDKAVTPMGSRTVKKWVVRPLVKQASVERRLDGVQHVLSNINLMRELEEIFRQVGDLERVVGRMALSRATLGDYLVLVGALGVLPSLRNLLLASSCEYLSSMAPWLDGFSPLGKLLMISINDDPSSDWMIKGGFDERLDELRDLINNGGRRIIELERAEQEATGITSLKIRYNQVHGYYIEVTKPNRDKVPERYIRQQTLVGRERFTVPELSKLQSEILSARSEVAKVERDVLERVRLAVMDYGAPLRKLAHTLSTVDALLSFARVAYDNGYVRPSFNDKRDVVIVDGQHPVVAKNLEGSFVPNSTELTDEQSLWIVTGPNMGGKSTYLRQVALISIMAQCGLFVPAKSASLPMLDRIFTRIGASDSVADGRSTFLVEMDETALICSRATENSLVILDEVGRGTSTFDGLAIAQAVVEYVYTKVKARCLFATHYHEITKLKEKFFGIESYHTTSKMTERGIVFLHKVAKGASDGSFGIEVAKLAELPREVIERATKILDELQSSAANYGGLLQGSFVAASGNGQKELRVLKKRVVELEDSLMRNSRLVETIRDVDYDNLSPKQALDLLWELKLKGDGSS